MMMNSKTNQNRATSAAVVYTAARSRLLHNIYKFNLFSDNPFWSPALTYSEQILSTRLFLLFVSISLLIVIGYASLLVRTFGAVKDQFSISDFERLQIEYPTTINVPCTQVSIPYSKFLNFSPEFHQVCSSEFIRKRWISSLFLSNATSHNILDFRTFTFSQFRSLRLLCRTARQAIKDAHRTFDSTHLVTNQLVYRTQFNEIASALFDNFQKNVIANENRTVNAVSMIIAQNQIFSALRTNSYIQSPAGSRIYATYNGIYLEHNGTNGSNCDCRLKGNQCIYPAGAFYNWTLPDLSAPAVNDPPPRFQIPGLMAGCMPLDSIRQSTLECLYNQSCVDAISLQPRISRGKALHSSLTRFNLNLTVGQIFNDSLFVETWNVKSSFEDYFLACSPRAIFYSYEGRFHPGTVITISLSAFGGLILVWQFLTPAIVITWNFIQSKRQQNQSSPHFEQTPAAIEMTPKKIEEVVSGYVRRTIYNFNLFPSDDKDDPEEERIGIISTRLYILLVILGLLILGFYTCLDKHNQTHTIGNPPLSKFEELHLFYSSTLRCPCSRFSTPHYRIMSIIPRYHTICSSEYLEDYWLSYFGVKEVEPDSIQFLTTDFRLHGQSFFDLIKILCKTANETIENALVVFQSTRLVTVNSLSRKHFTTETNRRLQEFEKQTISSFIYLIQLIRKSIQTNQLVEKMWTNAGPLSILNNQTLEWSLQFRSRNFYTNNCSCALSYKCTRPVGFYFQTDNTRSPPNITIPGLVTGCFTIDSLLLSTLECFYDIKCVELLINNYDFDMIDLVKPLDIRARDIQPLSNENSSFYPNTTIRDIFLKLFVEDWNASSDYTSYYERCAPSQCTYTVKQRFDKAYILAMMLGFCGGLTAILEIILPPLVKLIYQRWSKSKEQTQTDIPVQNDIDISTDVPRPPTKFLRDHFQDFRSLNLFSSDSPTTDTQLEHEEIIATRIYIFLFILCLTAALLYSGPFTDETDSEIKPNPTSDTVNNLHNQNISSLSCPCSTASVRYSKFISIHADYHRICSSKYVSPSYISDIFKNNDNISLKLSAHYRLLSSLCDSSRYMIENSLEVFGSQELITMETITQSSFDIQTNALISTFISQIPSNYRHMLSFIIGSFGSNQLLNVFTTNWKVYFTNEEDQNFIVGTEPSKFYLSNCTCAISSNCSERLTENIYTGCFPFDGFRLSKLENESLAKLNDQLFVDRWTNRTNYTAYFKKCKPLECSYTYRDTNNFLYIFTTLLGLYGGLTYGLHLIIGQSLRAYRWWTSQRRKQQIQITSIESMRA